MLGPLANDADADPGTLQITQLTGGGTLMPDGRSIRLETAPTATGTLILNYTVRNAIGLTGTATITVNILPDVVGDLLVHLPLDSDALDLSGHSNHGTPIGSPLHATGRLGGSMRLDSGAPR